MAILLLFGELSCTRGSDINSVMRCVSSDLPLREFCKNTRQRKLL
jgi:hypothetical protein